MMIYVYTINQAVKPQDTPQSSATFALSYNKGNKFASLYHRELNKEEKAKPKVSRRKSALKIRVEINEIQTKIKIVKIS